MFMAAAFTGYAQDPSAALQVDATDQGFLMPRMDSAARAAIGTPAAGLQVYDTDTNTIWFFDGTVWINTESAAGKWVDDANSDVVLNMPTALDSVKYTVNGFKNFDVNDLHPEFYLSGSGIITQNPHDNTRNLFKTDAKDISVENAFSDKAGAKYVTVANSADTNIASGTLSSLSGQVAVNSDNTNTYSVVRGINALSSFFGNTATSVIGFQSVGDLGPNSTSTNVYGINSTAYNRSSNTLTNLMGNRAVFTLAGSGNTNNVRGFYALGNTDETPSGNVTNYRIFESKMALSGYTGTINKAYDFFAGDFDAGSGTITNAYGVYIRGEKINYFEGSLGIGTDNPGAKLHVAGTAGTDGIMFPDGTLQTTAANAKFVDGVDPLEAVYTTGNVGIGLTNPAVTLDVNGATRIRSGATSGQGRLELSDGSGVASIQGHPTLNGIIISGASDGEATPLMVVAADKVGINNGTSEPTSALQVVGLAEYADDAAAGAAGLTAGAFYHTAGVVKVKL